MAIKEIRASYKEDKYKSDCCLCFSEKRGLYISRNANLIPQEDVIYRPHRYKGFRNESLTVAGLSIRVETNFGYGSRSFLRAVVEKDGKRHLDFDRSKLSVLNDGYVDCIEVASLDWEEVFEKIIRIYNNPNFELNISLFIIYVRELRDILKCDSIKIKGTYQQKKETKWKGGMLVTLFVAKKIRELITGLKLSQPVDENCIEEICKLFKDFLSKIREIDVNMDDSRVEQFSETLFLIHEFMHINKREINFFSNYLNKV